MAGNANSGRRPYLKPREKRKHVVRLFLNDAELKRLCMLAEALGVSPQEWLRLALGGSK